MWIHPDRRGPVGGILPGTGGGKALGNSWSKQDRPFSTKILWLKVEDTWWTPNRKGGSRETKKKERNDPDPTLDWTMEDIGDEKTRWRIVQGSIPHGTRTTKRVLVVRKIRVNSHPPKRERNMRSSTSEEENEGDAVNEPGQSKGSDVTEPIFPNEREFLVRMQIVDCAKEDVGQCRHDGRDTPRKSLS